MQARFICSILVNFILGDTAHQSQASLEQISISANPLSALTSGCGKTPALPPASFCVGKTPFRNPAHALPGLFLADRPSLFILYVLSRHILAHIFAFFPRLFPFFLIPLREKPLKPVEKYTNVSPLFAATPGIVVLSRKNDQEVASR